MLGKITERLLIDYKFIIMNTEHNSRGVKYYFKGSLLHNEEIL
jgi:hypothetical protein